MLKLLSTAAVVLLLGAPVEAQTLSGRVVRAQGTAVLSVQPDQLKLDIAAVTQADTAQNAAQQNAVLLSAVLDKVRAVLGSSGSVQTVAYGIVPNYKYPQGQPAVLTGYTVTNTVEATTSDLNSAGRLIDAAVGAGANSIQGLRFGVKDDSAVRAQALGQAARIARAHADAIAAGLGGRTGVVISAVEGSQTSPVVMATTSAAPATTTPIEPGLVQVTATVTVDVELL